MKLWQLYALTTVENLANFMAVLLGILGLILMVSSVIWLVSYESEPDEFRALLIHRSRPFAYAFLILGVVFCFIPSKKDIYSIIGGYYVTNIDGISQLPLNAVGAANEFLEGYIKEHEEKTTK